MKQTILLNQGFSREWTIERNDFTWREGYGGYPVVSRVFICPFCLTQWGKVVNTENSSLAEYFHIQPVCCERCFKPLVDLRFPTNQMRVPGSLVDYSVANGIDWGLLDSLPEVLLRREFDLTMKAWDSCA